MGKPLSTDLRSRLVAAVGGARGEAGRRLKVRPIRHANRLHLGCYPAFISGSEISGIVPAHAEAAMDNLLLTRRLLEWAVEGLDEALRQCEGVSAAIYRRALLHLEAAACQEPQEFVVA